MSIHAGNSDSEYNCLSMSHHVVVLSSFNENAVVWGNFWCVLYQLLTGDCAGNCTALGCSFEVDFITKKQDRIQAALWTNNNNNKA